MNTKNGLGKIVVSRKDSGTSLIRVGGDIHAIPKHQKKNTIASYTINEPDPVPSNELSGDTPYKTTVACGNRPQAPSISTTVDKKKHIPLTASHRAPEAKTTTKPPEEPDECIDEGLIVATKNGFYLVQIGDYLQDTTIKFLSADPTDKCVIKNVGRVELIETLYTSCMPSRWDFFDGVRKFTMASLYHTQPSNPFVFEQLEYFSGYYQDAVLIPHWGYHGVSTHMFSSAKLAGCALDVGQVWFTEGAMFTTMYKRDFTLKDVIGFDANDYPTTKSSVRIQQVNVPRSCEVDPTYPSNDVNARLVDKLNHYRYCLQMVDEVEVYEAARLLAEYYAGRMAEDKFVSHLDTGPYPTLGDRAEYFDIDAEEITEVLAKVSDPGLINPIENIDQVCDDLFTEWVSVTLENDKLVNTKYYRVAFGVAQADDGDWYGCGILLALPGDESPSYDTYTISLPDPPQIDIVVDSTVYINETDSGNTFRAFSQYPKSTDELSATAARWWDGEVAYFGYIVSFKDYGAYGLSSPEFLFDSEGVLDNEVISSAYLTESKVCTWPKELLTNGATIRPKDDTSGPSKFFIQYDSNHTRSVYLKVYSAAQSEYEITPDTPPDGDYRRDTVIPGPGEDTEDSGTPVGKVELYVGNTLVDTTHRFGQGDFTNPFQSISVGSVFHTSSGYTVLLYTINKTIQSTYYTWWTSEYLDVREMYYWMKQTLWCAVIDPGGARIARWKVGAMNPEIGEDPEYKKTYKYETPVTPTTDFNIQFNGEIKKGTVKVFMTIEGEAVMFTDDSDGALTEVEDQHSKYTTLLSSSSIDYNTGLVTYSVSVAPDLNEDVIHEAEVAQFVMYHGLSTYTEIVGYLGISGDTVYGQPFKSIEFEGLGCRFGEATITNDGHYVVFSSVPVYFKSGRGFRFLKDSELLELGVDQPAVTGKGSKPQVVVYDLFSLTAEEPARVSNPLLLVKDDEYTDVMVLN